MLIDLQYVDDGFRATVLLTDESEQGLTDEELARHLWWPEQLEWIVPGVLANAQPRPLAQMPRGQLWSIERSPVDDATKAAALLRLRPAVPDEQIARLASSSWQQAVIHFPEG